ncbi:MAG: hypothetical protein M3R65_02490 [Gemmatimonadota bacterium]|nr:hypothetical protein [Gemmatimonadota bacterium]
MGPEVIVPISGMLMILGLALGVPLVRSYVKGVERRPRESLPSGDVVARLERIEQAIEAMATEVERVAEGQRFTTKLLSEVRSSPPALAAQNAAAGSLATTPSTMQADGTVLSEAARRS